MTEKQLERRIKEVYSEATNDLQRKWDDYFERRSKDIAETENALKQAKIDQNQELSDKLEKELEQKKYNLTLGNKQYKDMVAQTTKRIAEANQIAVAYANDAAATFYTQGFNETIPEVAEAGVRFDMQDEATVRRLIKDGDIQMPKRKLDIPKDERWNTKQINSQVLQGIIQGESMDKIANRLQPIMDNNRASAMRNARTLVNGAENLGRLDRAHELEQNGVILHKIWIATGDDRTRDIHLEIDGQEVELDEPFVDGNGNELQYPCDPNAEPETVYNCRCTYIRKVVGFVKEDGTVEKVDYDAETEQHKEEIEQEQERREEEQTERAEKTEGESKEETPEESEKSEKKQQNEINSIVQGSNIAGEWQRRESEYDFAIKDVIAAQGYDGLPTILYGEDFEKAVQEANGGNGFVAQRTYCASDQATIESYAEQLRYGEWYVECSVGGAQYGQGMYCAADYQGNLSQGIQAEMSHYQQLGDRRGYPYNATETLTLSPDAKVFVVPRTEDAYDLISEKYINEYMRNSAMQMNNEDRRAAYEVVKINQEINTNYNLILSQGRNDLVQRNNELLVERQEIYNNHPEVQKVANDSISSARKLDAGTMAASMGYDAINAEGHGQSGSYTVILNRTKVILKGNYE